MSIRVITDAQ